MNARKLPRSFYLRPTIIVAKNLLGMYLVRNLRGTKLVGKIVEVEAYLGDKDPASHAYRGMTKRNEVMFEKGGHLYVYFTYGMHYCANVVTEKRGTGRAVLLRAVEPLKGIAAMKKHRGFKGDKADERLLTNGPARLCQAFGIARQQNGADLLGTEIFVARGEPVPRHTVAASSRIGIRNGKGKQWRFYVKGSPFISRR